MYIFFQLFSLKSLFMNDSIFLCAVKFNTYVSQLQNPTMTNQTKESQLQVCNPRKMFYKTLCMQTAWISGQSPSYSTICYSGLCTLIRYAGKFLQVFNRRMRSEDIYLKADSIVKVILRVKSSIEASLLATKGQPTRRQGQRATDILFCCVFIKCKLSYFSTKSYVVTIRWNRLVETIPTNGHNIGFS